MTKKERAFIEDQIAKFECWSKQELDSAYSTVDDLDEAKLQVRLNDCAANTLRNLLYDLDSGV